MDRLRRRNQQPTNRGKGCEGRLLHIPCPFGKKALGKKKSNDRLEFMLLRKRFLAAASGEQGGGDLDNDFDFDEYLAHNASHLATEVVEIPPIEWFFLEVMFVMIWAAMQAPPYLRVRLYMAYTLCMFVFLIQINGKLEWILHQIIVPYKRAGTNSEKIAPSETTDDPSPLFLTNDWAKARLGALLQKKAAKKSKHGHGDHGHGGDHGHAPGHSTPDCAQACLFWNNDPQLVLHCIRFCLLISLIHFVMYVHVLPFCWYSSYRNILFIPALLPLPFVAFCVWWAPSEFIRKLTMCTSVEQLKNPKLIKRTLRNVRLKKTLRALKALRAMKNKVAAKTQVGDTDSKDEELTPDELASQAIRRAELQEMFNLFDLDKGGDVQKNELGGLMQALGIACESTEMEQIFHQFDNDNSGAITFDEFWQYMKQRDSDPDPEELCKEIFAMIDEDGSGTLSSAEFAKMMHDLKSGLSVADVESLVKEIDKSGDGQISYGELAAVLTRYKD